MQGGLLVHWDLGSSLSYNRLEGYLHQTLFFLAERENRESLVTYLKQKA